MMIDSVTSDRNKIPGKAINHVESLLHLTVPRLDM